MTATTQDVRLAKRYTPVQAARLAGVSPQAAREWFGDLPADGRVSFLELVELAVARAFHEGGAPWDWTRDLRGHLAREWREAHPFASVRMKRDGPGAVAAFAPVPRPSGTAFSASVARILDTIEHDRDGIAMRWLPYGSDAPVAIDPANYGGEPTIPSRRIPVSILQWRYFDGGETVSHLAQDFDLPPQTIEAIIRLPRLAS